MPHNLYFNFHYLPFKQAVLWPIWLRRPSFHRLKGKIIINGKVRPGMITLGTNNVLIFSNRGISIDNRGIIVFNGYCNIGNDSYLQTGEEGVLSFGDNFKASTAFRISCFKKIAIGSDVLVGWNCLIYDQNYHDIYDMEQERWLDCFGTVSIGDHCWLCSYTTIQKNSVIPNNTIVGNNSLVNKDLSIPEYCLVAGVPAKLVKQRVNWKF